AVRVALDRLVVGGDHAGDVADDDGCHLGVGDLVGGDHGEVDRVLRGAEQVPPGAERVRQQGQEDLPLENQQREVVGDRVAEHDGEERRILAPGLVHEVGIVPGQDPEDPDGHEVGDRDGGDRQQQADGVDYGQVPLAPVGGDVAPPLRAGHAVERGAAED